MTIFKTSDIKASPGKIFEAAKSSPQYLVREDTLFVLSVADLTAGVVFRPDGYFADSYNDPERAAVEKAAFTATKFKAER